MVFVHGDVDQKLYLKYRSQQVIVDRQKVIYLALRLVSLKGRSLHPSSVLFLCFINDLPNRITSNYMLMMLYTSIYSQDNCYRLQQDLDILEQLEDVF